MLFKKKFKTTVYVNGMNCGHCAAKVEKTLSDLTNGTVKVDLEKKCAYVKSEIPLNEKEIFDAISEIGFIPIKIEA